MPWGVGYLSVTALTSRTSLLIIERRTLTMFKVRSKNNPMVKKTVYAATQFAQRTSFLIYDEELDLWLWVSADSYVPETRPVRKKNVESSEQVL